MKLYPALKKNLCIMADLYLKVEPRRKRLTAEGRRAMSVFTDLSVM